MTDTSIGPLPVSRIVPPISSTLFMDADPIYSCQLDNRGGCTVVNSSTEASVKNPCWIHLDSTKQESIDWINSTSLIPDIVKTSLINQDQQAKEVRIDSGLLVVLKGSKDLGSDLSVIFRFYITDNLIISTRHQRLDVLHEVQKNLDNKIGPTDVADWLIQVCDLLTDRADIAVDSVHSKVAKLEDSVLNQKNIPHKDIGNVRKQLIILRRLLSPGRDVIVKIATERLAWIDSNDRQHIHDVATRLGHYIDDIDTCLLRIGSIMTQIHAMLAESMNKRIYLMSLFAMIFMPITFLTSLLGINLSGIPFSQDPWAFIVFSVLLFILTIIFMFWLKYKKWL